MQNALHKILLIVTRVEVEKLLRNTLQFSLFRTRGMSVVRSKNEYKHNPFWEPCPCRSGFESRPHFSVS